MSVPLYLLDSSKVNLIQPDKRLFLIFEKKKNNKSCRLDFCRIIYFVITAGILIQSFFPIFRNVGKSVEKRK